MNARGEIKFSPNGNWLAFNGNGTGDNDVTNMLTLFSFNKTTGVVSPPIDLPYSRGDFGLSFSPDNSKLYGTTWKAFNFSSGDSNYIYQFDLSGGNAATIIASKQTIASPPFPTSYGDTKLGPDGKIYVATNYSQYLGVIPFPDLPGAACQYESDGFYLGRATVKFGLNNYIEYETYCHHTASLIENNFDERKLEVYPNRFSDKTTL